MAKTRDCSLVILGDSYSTFKGCVPDGHFIYYPKDGIDDVVCADDTWWRQLIARRSLRLLINDSFSGSTISTRVRENHTVADAFVSRMKATLSENGVGGEQPELILIFGGTNDSWIDNEIGVPQYSGWSEEDLKKVLPAYCFLLDYVTRCNPAATVVGIINSDIKPAIQDGIEESCRHYGVPSLRIHDVSKIGGHPDGPGMTRIAEQLDAFLDQINK